MNETLPTMSRVEPEAELPEISEATRMHTSDGIRVSYQIITQPDVAIAKNNRLALMMEIHAKRTAQGPKNEVKPREEVESMVKKPTSCECCGKIKALSMCSSQLLCSTCASMAGAVSSRSGIIVKMLIKRGNPEAFLGLLVEKLGPAWLMSAVQQFLPEQVAVQVESATLDEIAAVIGYTGESSEGLVARIAEMSGWSAPSILASNHEHLAELRLNLLNDIAAIVGVSDGRNLLPENIEDYAQSVFQAGQARIDELEGRLTQKSLDIEGYQIQCQTLSELVEVLEAERDRLYTYLGIDKGDEPRSEIALQAVALQAQTLDRYRATCERSADEKNLLADQLAMLEQTETVNEQIFARLREILNADGLANGEIPSALDSLLHEGLINAGVRINERLPVSPPVTSGPSRLDGHLLDLLIEYPSIGVERIAVLREAA